MRILLFAALRELAGSSRLDIPFADAPTVGALAGELERRFGAEFGRILSAGSIVVNGERAGPAQALGTDDEVALLPPVSGGGHERSD